MAIITLLVGVYHLSRRDAVACVSDVLGVPISLGALSKVEGRVAAMLEPAHQEAAVRRPGAGAWGQDRGVQEREIVGLPGEVFHSAKQRFAEVAATLI
ncbi:MAG: hypothetical protein IT541_17370, partial [Hyphomicrobiales bacterium]|nr:hypothetical protein [Hyphomicrobiales bacterium]